MIDSNQDDPNKLLEKSLNEEIDIFSEGKRNSSFILSGNLREFDDSVNEMDNSFDLIVNSLANKLSGQNQQRHIFQQKYSMDLNYFDNCDASSFNTESSLSKRSKDSQDESDSLRPSQSVASSHSLKSYRSADEIEARFRIDKLQNSDLASYGCATTTLTNGGSDDRCESGQHFNYRLPSELQSAGLRTITGRTLVQLLRGEFRENLKSFQVIDCRYPYEFEAGHIEGSINIFNLQQAIEFLYEMQNTASTDQSDYSMMKHLESSQLIRTENLKPKFDSCHIIILHCEFSVNRAPSLARAIRRFDRVVNGKLYPSLHYPEIYVLQGGYKQFFEQFSATHCRPEAYQRMHDINFTQQMKYYRDLAKKKSSVKYENRSINSRQKENQQDACSTGLNTMNGLTRSRSLKF